MHQDALMDQDALIHLDSKLNQDAILNQDSKLGWRREASRLYGWIGEHILQGVLFFC